MCILWHKPFHWRIIAFLTQIHTVLMFMDITAAPKLYRKYVETWVFLLRFQSSYR